VGGLACCNRGCERGFRWPETAETSSASLASGCSTAQRVAPSTFWGLGGHGAAKSVFVAVGRDGTWCTPKYAAKWGLYWKLEEYVSQHQTFGEGGPME
jgi:hypothetical protein